MWQLCMLSTSVLGSIPTGATTLEIKKKYCQHYDNKSAVDKVWANIRNVVCI
jgi:hypothetical protein